jgi:hypothetical protein
MRALLVALAAVIGLTFVACGGGAPADTRAEGPAPVARIVFLDQEECCACTRDRTDATWAALQGALENDRQVPVERIHSDTQAELAGPYLTLRPMMVVPGLYFLDADDQLVEMLQGELTAEAIGAPL